VQDVRGRTWHSSIKLSPAASSGSGSGDSTRGGSGSGGILMIGRAAVHPVHDATQEALLQLCSATMSFPTVYADKSPRLIAVEYA
jgi:hypothetical protein